MLSSLRPSPESEEEWMQTALLQHADFILLDLRFWPGALLPYESCSCLFLISFTLLPFLSILQVEALPAHVPLNRGYYLSYVIWNKQTFRCTSISPLFTVQNRNLLMCLSAPPNLHNPLGPPHCLSSKFQISQSIFIYCEPNYLLSQWAF